MNMSFMNRQGSKAVFSIYFWLVLLAVLLWGPLAEGTAQTTPSAYERTILAHRAGQDSSFKVGEYSPLSPEDKKNFTGLAYFPIDEAFHVQAKFVRTAQEAIFQMPTTGSLTPDYVKYGELHFNLQGQPLKLHVYQNQELIKQPKYLTYLFIPFTDSTTGHETYETGRYLDFSIPMGTDSVWLDFNKAYNPYCAYSAGYSCPIPPKENKLLVRVEAGEKTYEKKQEELYLSVIEEMPVFPGGEQDMKDFMNKNFKVSKAVWKARINGSEIITFIVEKDGTAGSVESKVSLHPDLFAEAVRLVGTMPKWKPATQNGEPVRVRYTVPIKITTRK